MTVAGIQLFVCAHDGASKLYRPQGVHSSLKKFTRTHARHKGLPSRSAAKIVPFNSERVAGSALVLQPQRGENQKAQGSRGAGDQFRVEIVASATHRWGAETTVAERRVRNNRKRKVHIELADKRYLSE